MDEETRIGCQIWGIIGVITVIFWLTVFGIVLAGIVVLINIL